MSINSKNHDSRIIKHSQARYGNQNARKHGFYSRVLDEQGRRDYEQALDSQGLEEEIALMRARLLGVLRKDPNNTKLILKALNMLVRLLMAHRNIARGDKPGLKQALMKVLTGVVLPLGIELGKILHE